MIATSCLPNCMPLGACDQSRLEWACAPQWRARALGRAFRGSRGVSHDGMCVSDLRVFLDVGAIATVPTPLRIKRESEATPRPGPGARCACAVLFVVCLWCCHSDLCHFFTCASPMDMEDGGFFHVPRSRASLRDPGRSSIHIASSEPFCIVHRDPHRSILGRAWRAHALRGRCVGVRGSCLALSLESGYEDRVQIQIFEHSTPVVLNVVVASFAGGNDSELIWMDAIECLCVGVAPWLPPIVTTRQSPQAEPPWWTHRSELRRRIRQFLSAA